MNLFKKILVPTDFSQCADLALERAFDLASLNGGTVMLFHVFQMPPIYPSGPVVTAEIIQATEDAARAALVTEKTRVQAKLDRSADPQRRPELTTRLQMGSASDEILEEARRGKYDLIVIGTHGRTGLKHLFLGSVAERVVRVAPCPVLTMRAQLVTDGDARAVEARS